MRRPTPSAPRPPRHDRTAPSRSRTVRARARPHPASTPAHPGHANPPDRSRSSTATGSVSTVSIAPPSATTRPSRTLPAKDNSGRAVAYPDPKIVTVAAPTNPVNTTRPPACRSARSTTPTSPYVVILNGGQHSYRARHPAGTHSSGPRGSRVKLLVLSVNRSHDVRGVSGLHDVRAAAGVRGPPAPVVVLGIGDSRG